VTAWKTSEEEEQVHTDFPGALPQQTGSGERRDEQVANDLWNSPVQGRGPHPALRRQRHQSCEGGNWAPSCSKQLPEIFPIAEETPPPHVLLCGGRCCVVSSCLFATQPGSRSDAVSVHNRSHSASSKPPVIPAQLSVGVPWPENHPRPGECPQTPQPPPGRGARCRAVHQNPTQRRDEEQDSRAVLGWEALWWSR